MSTMAQTSAGRRIEALLDDNSFVEIGGLITARSTDFNLTSADAPADGVITGYGTVDGSLVYVYSQDSTVLNGSIGEMHAKKIVNVYDMALKMGAPVIGLIDCAGLRLQESTDALNALGSIYAKQTAASGAILQISAVFGECGGGLAVLSELSDFTFMETKGKLFINSPNTLTGNKTEDTAGAAFQSEEAGTVDFVGDEADVLSNIRRLITILPSNYEDEAIDACSDDLNRLTPQIEDVAADPACVLAAVSDGNLWVEVKSAYAKEIVTGFIKLNGATVGAVANRTEVFAEGKSELSFENVLTANGAKKAAGFVKFCDAFHIPVLTLTNVRGYEATRCSEKRIASAAAALTAAFANATVPKVTVVTGEAFGSAGVIMNSKSVGADIVYAWPSAAIGTMDAADAAKIIYAKEPSMIEEKTAEYQALQSGAASAAKRGYVDSILEPADTRKYLIGAFEMLYSKKTAVVSKKHSSV